MKIGNALIRQMEPRDIETVLDIDRRIARGGGRVITAGDIVSTGAGGQLDYSFVAEVDGRVVGFVLARLAYLGVPFDEVCVIHAVVVEPRYQKSGLARDLVNRVIQRCYDEGVARIRMLIEGHNISLQQFVERLGFRRSAIVNYDMTLKQ